MPFMLAAWGITIGLVQVVLYNLGERLLKNKYKN
jgi:hypothetical protein